MLVDQFGNSLKTTSNKLVPLSVRGDTRLTYDDYYLTPFSTGFAYIAPDRNSDWKLESVDEVSLATKTAPELINIFVNSSPDLDRALHETVRFCNTGWSLTCEDVTGQRVLDNAIDQMSVLGQDLDTKIDSLISSAFLWGALYTESIFDPIGQDFVDLAIISPSQARYQRREDPVRGQYWQLGQEEKGRFVPLDDPTIMYKPINPIPDKPFGRPMVSSSLFAIVFQLGLIKSLRQVIETQAWPRQIWKIDREILHNANINDIDKKKIIKETEENLERYMNNINRKKGKQPIVGSEVSNETIGGVNRSNFGAVSEILERIDTWIVRGLKQYPVLFGSNNKSGLSDNSNIQLEAHSIFIDSIQSSIEDMVSNQFNLVLAAAGFPQLKAIFKIARVNSLVRQQRAISLEREANSINQLLTDRVIDRSEARQLLHSFSNQFGELDLELPTTIDVSQVLQMVATGMITAAEGRQLIISQNDEFQGLSAELPSELERDEEEPEDDDE